MSGVRERVECVSGVRVVVYSGGDEDSLKAVSIVWSIHPVYNSQVNGPHQSLHSDLR